MHTNRNKKTTANKPIISFDFEEGRILAKKYKVLQHLGTGYEGEVYLLMEIETGIERAGKFFFPHRNIKNRNLKRYAKKLHKLKHSSILIHYNTIEKIIYRRQEVNFLISEFVDGELLSSFIARQPGKRLHPFLAVHLLHALAAGVESVHAMKEYHGDLHTDNVIVNRYGLGFDLKLFDLYEWHDSKLDNIREDVVKMIHIFYESLGGSKYYAKQPKEIKAICCGLKRSLILKKFKTAGRLKNYLENVTWE
jgi:serine/threonine protein kinase